MHHTHEPSSANPLARGLRAVALAAALSTAAGAAMSGAVIFNDPNPAMATVALGVNDQGHLNFFDSVYQTSNAGAVGLAWRFPGGDLQDATAPGCLCEGWGVAVTTSAGRVAGYASVDTGGVVGLTGGLFSSTTTKATSQVSLVDAPIVVTHQYGVSLAPNLFQGNVTITNVGAETVSDVVYRRAMDWDVPPTEFNEFVTHKGVEANLVSNGGNVLFASNNGFALVDPRSNPGEIYSGLDTTTINTDFQYAGPADHGSVFDFSFGDLEPGAARTFNIFYGAAPNEAGAMAALSVINPNLYSLGQSASDSGAATDSPTFIFAFGGVGGSAPGSSPDNPVLPIVDVGTGVMEFAAPVPRLWYDPPFAVGFKYELTGDTDTVFTGVMSPMGFGDLTIRLPDGTEIPLLEGIEYRFGDAGFEPKTFEILGLMIDTGAPGYDPRTAFPTFLDWRGTADYLFMTILDSPTGGGSVPVPGTLLLVAAGLGLMAASRRRSWKTVGSVPHLLH